MAFHNDQGAEAERLAVSYLIGKGYQILERNWRFGKAEVDIIAQYASRLVFLEVKARSGSHYGLPQDFVSRKKIALMAQAAGEYVSRHHFQGEIRFDIISVLFGRFESAEIAHIEDAFWPEK